MLDYTNVLASKNFIKGSDERELSSVRSSGGGGLTLTRSSHRQKDREPEMRQGRAGISGAAIVPAPTCTG